MISKHLKSQRKNMKQIQNNKTKKLPIQLDRSEHREVKQKELHPVFKTICKTIFPIAGGKQ